MLPAQLTCAQFVKATAGGECAERRGRLRALGRRAPAAGFRGRPRRDEPRNNRRDSGERRSGERIRGHRRRPHGSARETNRRHPLRIHARRKTSTRLLKPKPTRLKSSSRKRSSRPKAPRSKRPTRPPASKPATATAGSHDRRDRDLQGPGAPSRRTSTLGGKAEISDPQIGQTGRFALVGGSPEVKVVEGGNELTALEAEELPDSRSAKKHSRKATPPSRTSRPNTGRPRRGTTATLMFRARVTNVAENKAGKSIPNVARLKWEDPLEKALRKLESADNPTPIVEPRTDARRGRDRKEAVHGGQVVKYKLALGNASGPEHRVRDHAGRESRGRRHAVDQSRGKPLTEGGHD